MESPTTAPSAAEPRPSTFARARRRAYRLATARWRALPDAIIIGGQKCGTTSLFHYLRQHPQLVPSYAKEVHYFDGGTTPDRDDHARGERWYRSYFPMQSSVQADQLVFEGSPRYLFDPDVPDRIAGLLPGCKLVVLLRHPTDRAISHYYHVRQRGQEPLELPEALAAEEDRLADPDPRTRRANAVYHSYKARGRYAEQLRRYLERFPRQQLLVLQSELLFTEPEQVLDRVHRFLGVDPGFETPDLRRWNVGALHKDVGLDTYRSLDEHFAPHNEDLYDLLGERYDWVTRRA
jgi:hypothetical protein